MLSWLTGSTLLGYAAVATDPTLTTGGLVVTGLTFVGIFIRHQQAEIKRLTERLDEAAEKAELRDAEIAQLKEQLSHAVHHAPTPPSDQA